MNVFFADAVNGNSSLDGRQNVLLYTTGLQYDLSTRRLYSSTSAFSGYSHAYGDYLWVQGTGWTDGLYMIKQKIDSDTIELETWDSSLGYGDSGYLATIPGVLPAITGGGTVTGLVTGSGPKDTIAGALGLFAAGGDQYLHLTGTFTETLTPGITAASGAPNLVLGYGTYPGDGEQATIDGEDTRSHCINASSALKNHWIFRHLLLKRAILYGFQTGSNIVDFDDMTAVNNAVGGWMNGAYQRLTNSQIASNTDGGLGVPGGAIVANTRITGNGSDASGHGVLGRPHLIDCLVADNAGDQVYYDGTGVINIERGTIDANGNNNGIVMVQACGLRVADTIVCGASVAGKFGIKCPSLQERSLGENMLFWDNDENVQNFRVKGGIVEGDPLFNDRSVYDYRLKVGSPAAGRGLNGGNIGFDPRHLTHLRTPFV